MRLNVLRKIGKRALCYFYRTSSGLEIDLVVDYGDFLEIFEIKFSTEPKQGMVRSLLQFQKEFPVKKASLLNLRKESIFLSKEIIAEHWMNVSGDSVPSEKFYIR